MAETVKKSNSEQKRLSLKVSEADPKDVGRGFARLDPKDYQKLGLDIGDIIEISGKEKTVAKIMPLHVEYRGKEMIQMDGIIRENAKVSLDEKVSIKKVHAAIAKSLTLKVLTALYGPREADSSYIGHLLEGQPLMKGDRVRATLFGTRSREFEVIQTHPTGAVIVNSTTKVFLKTEKGKETERVDRAEITYEDIGGLSRQIGRIREMIELPLKYPQIFDRLGIDAPKGVLLFGPPGTGKTLIAKAVAHETDASFFHVNGPEIVHKFYGQSEAQLRAIFEEASKDAPSIIFLDEIDAIAPKRQEVTGDVEKRIVAQLLALMDGLKSRGQVIVIGATNIPDVLDPALRRPGRFDREIEIGIPDKNGREAILHIHTRGMPLSDNVDIKKLSEITHGFVGADIEALCREAAMTCLRTVFPEIDFNLDEISYETISKLEVTMDHFMSALNEVEPSAIREVFVEVPNVKWDDVGGLDEVKEALKETVEWPLKYEKLFLTAKVAPAKGTLLYGPPGTGKTLLAKALAHESGVNFISIKGPSLLSKWVGESEKGVREIFKKAKQASPCIVFFDEIDALVPVRGGHHDSGVTERVISQFLTELDGIEELKGVIVLAATNRRDMIDPALLRAGRFDLSFELPPPDDQAREAIFHIHSQGKPLAKGISFKEFSKKTEGYTGADIEGICKKATLYAIRKFIEKHGGKAEKEARNLIISEKDFDLAFSEVKKQRKSS